MFLQSLSIFVVNMAGHPTSKKRIPSKTIEKRVADIQAEFAGLGIGGNVVVHIITNKKISGEFKAPNGASIIHKGNWTALGPLFSWTQHKSQQWPYDTIKTEKIPDLMQDYKWRLSDEQCCFHWPCIATLIIPFALQPLQLLIWCTCSNQPSLQGCLHSMTIQTLHRLFSKTVSALQWSNMSPPQSWAYAIVVFSSHSPSRVTKLSHHHHH